MIKYIFLIVLVTGLSSLMFIFPYHKEPPKQLKGYIIQKAVIGKNKYNLYIADSSQKQSRGLSDIDKLNNNEGMLFIFPQKGKYQFWMKDMLFSLDFIFIDGNKIIDIKSHVVPDSYPNIIAGNGYYDKVVEIPAGSSEGLKINESISFF